jgi:hypothetical protein
MTLRFEKIGGHWQAHHHGIYGIVMPIPVPHNDVHEATWAIGADPRHTVKWNRAKTVAGAKRACLKVMREGADWKERRKTPTLDLHRRFTHLAGEVCNANDPQRIYRKVMEMRHLWIELERRGEAVRWPDGRHTPNFLSL